MNGCQYVPAPGERYEGPLATMQMQQPPPRRSKQQALSDAVVRTGAIRWLRGMHDRGRKPVLLLAYHRVCSAERPDDYPLDLGLISATPAEFDAQMAAIRQFANPVSLDQIADAVTHGRTLPDRAVAVTFDDSFRDTFEIAFPLLRRHSVPATVFISTELVERHEPFWFELVAHLMLRVPARSVTFEECPEGLPLADDIPSRRESIAKLHTLLKRCDNPRRRRLVDQWRTRFGEYIDARASELSHPVSRDQILTMAANGVAFGSHTMSHPNLALASTGLIQEEMRGSKGYLENLLGRPVRALAYPFGTPDTYDARAVSAARDCGYELAITYRQGVNWLGSLSALELRRIGISPGVTANQFRAMLALPGWLHPHLSGDH